MKVDFDFYRRIPKDLTEATAHGSYVSICALVFILILFIAEFTAFLSTTIISNVVIDTNDDALMRINFNITVMDMPCEFATIDVVDILGTRSDNVTKNVHKWHVDESGVRRGFEGRNLVQKDLMHDEHHDLVTLHANGMHAIPMDEASFDNHINHRQYTFANFYAPWCIWCQRLEPVYEALAEAVEAQQLPISIVKIDCVENKDLCMKYKIQAFPTLKLFKKAEVQPPDYRSDRTVDAFIEFLKEKLQLDEELAKMGPQEQAEHMRRLKTADHPGCMMTGFLLVNRVPGNFHIEARSKHHNLNPKLANISHIVNHLSFGQVLSSSQLKKLKSIPEEYFSLESTKPFDGNVYMTKELHQAYHHYIKVVSSHLDLGGKYRGKNAILAYQMVQSSQVMQYEDDEVPEARFSYDLSPMSVSVKRKSTSTWYQFVTSICALIGGTFTVFQLVNSGLGVVFKAKKI